MRKSNQYNIPVEVRCSARRPIDVIETGTWRHGACRRYTAVRQTDLTSYHSCKSRDFTISKSDFCLVVVLIDIL